MKCKLKVRVPVSHYTNAVFLIFGNILCLVGSEKINSEVCGLSKPYARIMHGHKSSTGDIPWIVHQLSIFKTDIPRACGGSIIAPSYVLTAAHCVYRRTTSETAYQVFVHYNSSQPDKGPRAEVDHIKVHPAFKTQKEGNLGYDIAVMKLNTPLVFDLYVIPVCLPVNKTEFLGIALQIAGWGAWEKGETSVELRSAITRGMEYADCDSIMKFTEIGVNKSLIICSHMEGGQTCVGDSGGPLTGVGAQGRSVLLGVAVSGTSCYEHLGFGLFTKVSFYVPWIKKEIKVLDKMPRKPSNVQKPSKNDTAVVC